MVVINPCVGDKVIIANTDVVVNSAAAVETEDSGELYSRGRVLVGVTS